MTFSKKTAVVTGASSGIGAVYADRLAARGFDLVLVARRGDRLEALARTLAEKHGVSVRSLVADLEKEADVARVEEVLASDDNVQMLVNNAGVARLSTLAETAVDVSVSQVALNVIALTRLTHAVLPAFLARNQGTIINIASVLSVHSWEISSVYSGTKSYVLAFSRGIQDELAKARSNVKLQVVLPASTATEIWSESVSGIPLSALGQDTIMSAEDCVDAALAGLDQGEIITFPSVEDGNLWSEYDSVRGALFAATQTGTPASRYRLSR
ncbi:SDR family NAD(P)-dependent oxidoreductase [Pseudomonas sp. Pseusp122]|uniref:SDR family NAD(P)-dependent oxidoreductase n=1 Tax=unclassified Pseudomonas TaxID=196821 RepID=UPI0039A6CD25